MAIGVRNISPDTIAAVATAAGRSALATIRVSGAATRAIGARLLQPWPLPDRVPTLCVLRSSDGTVVDQPLATLFPQPASYTGEDVLELSTHGGQLVPALALAAIIEAGAREALPGEFTRRAVLNGKLDILQAEAIADLIDARTEALHHSAVLQLDGALSRQIKKLREDLIGLEALISYDIDFPEEDDGPIARATVFEAAAKTISGLQQLVDTAPVGELIREGAVAVIAGRPNAGKSSLFNALIGQSRAIVTDIPGTTRDAIEIVVEVKGWPVRLVDTAGLRDTADVVERLGVEVSERYLAGAHVVLLCADNPDELTFVHDQVARLTSAPIVDVLTKVDLMPKGYKTTGTSSVIPVSAVKRSGLSELLEQVRDVLVNQYGSVLTDRLLVTRVRHVEALRRALSELKEFEAAWRSEALPSPVAAVHLRAAGAALEEIIGSVEIDDVLDRLFSTFCIGK
ncbi:MAG: tRNA uridine-5-carboxymethylaminomethyl(34) synthesis GTPase MnmE [Nitrospiraceae bacterium]|nr:tRNA uridine-5-carboxymethylaminomethyl(34) synthesis GTPase MnmE [Nitrospiraceae bacterium]